MDAEAAAIARCQAQAEAALFDHIAGRLRETGWVVVPDALPVALGEALLVYLERLDPAKFARAGVGRRTGSRVNDFVRRDEICWIIGDDPAPAAWLDFAARLRVHLNRRLLIGLFSFESHFAHYGVGDFYRRHVDAFKGEANRVVSLVTYLNPGWGPDDGGELVLYPPGSEPVRVTPAFGTMVGFLSEEFVHEVLPARRERRSIAGWFRVNTTTATRVDPPR